MKTGTLRLGLSLMVVIGCWANRLPAQEILVVPTVEYEPEHHLPQGFPFAPRPQPAPVTAVTATQPHIQVGNKFQDLIGHEGDYSWITGQLYYVRADGGRWVLRYGRIDEVDRFGGSVVLAPTVEMRNFREGDVVCVFGQVMSDGPATRALGGPLYRANSISMVERSDP